ncbi:hypothetical protein JNUCC83_06330 [Vagococcus sp. JNUCC 83]
MKSNPIELNHYYHDRGIKKYLGFYLSEHTREIHHMKEQANMINHSKPMMDLEDIMAVVNDAIVKDFRVNIQPNIADVDTGSFFNELTGHITGFTETTIYVDHLAIELSLIRHIELVSDKKWYESSSKL